MVHSPGTFYWFHHCCYVLFHNELLPYLLQKTSHIHRTYCQDPQLLHHLPNPLHQPWFHQLLLIQHCQPTQTVLSWCLQTMRVPSNQAHLEGSLKTALQRGLPQKAFICSQFRNHASTFSRVNLLWWPPFWSTTHTRFAGLLQLGELVENNKPVLWDWKRITMWHLLELLLNAYAFSLPCHKGDLVFEGNHVVCQRITGAPDPVCIMHKYIDMWDRLHPLHPQLWLQSDSSPPVHTWWISQFWCFFLDTNFTGQSMCVGGATTLAEASTAPNLIMGSGQQTSAAWTSYMQKNPILLHALLLACTTHFQPLAFT